MKPPQKKRPMFNGFYKGKSVLLTGHTGFKGSWLALWLHELGARVTGFALPPNSTPSHFELIGLKDLIAHREGDIRDLHALTQAFEAARPEIVFHLAAQPIVRESYDDPKTTFDTNIGGTVNVLEAIRHTPSVRSAVIITSDKCYDNREWVWGYREIDPLGGHDPYSASKGAAEIVCTAYHRSYFAADGRGPHPGFATARAGNVIGGGDWAKDRIIPDCVRALSSNKPIVVRNPNATRPWQHVLDPLHGYLALAQQLWHQPDRYNGAWNFGPGASDQITVRELSERFILAWGSGRIKTPPRNQHAPHEAHLLRLNTDKASLELKWQSTLASAIAIVWTVAWYKSWHAYTDNIKDLSVHQIRAFQKLVQQP